jgi:hypothetical protein
VRGEDLLNDPNAGLSAIAGWLGLREDAAAIEEMKHPERSRFATLGPPTARFGNDPHFLEDPRLHRDKVKAAALDGPLDWRDDVRGFSARVTNLARGFGYT